MMDLNSSLRAISESQKDHVGGETRGCFLRLLARLSRAKYFLKNKSLLSMCYIVAPFLFIQCFRGFPGEDECANSDIARIHSIYEHPEAQS